MKTNHSIFALIFCLFTIPTWAGVSIISDLDDTIKITDVKSPIHAAINGIFKKEVFTGMTEFFKGAESYSNGLHVISASPGFIKKSVYRTLNSNDIKFESVSFKNPFKREGKIEYKIKKIKEIMDASSDDFILMGDDVDLDPEIYEEVQKLYPNRILSTYIHMVRHREIPGNPIVYWNTADLALREYLAGRMSEESASTVLDSLINEDNLNHVIPSWADCPTESTIWDWQIQTSLSDKASEIINRLIKHCTPVSKS